MKHPRFPHKEVVYPMSPHDGLLERADSAARRFDPGRAKQNATRIWEAARLMDTPAVHRAAETAVAILKEAGIDDVRIDNVPADGRSEAGGWIMPIAWRIEHASLRFADPPDADTHDDASIVLARYSEDPQSIAPWSPATPNGAPCRGRVLTARQPTHDLPRGLSGAFLYLAAGRPTEDLNEAAAEAGALGVIATRVGAYPDASRFDNAAVPKHADRRCIPSFSLSPSAGKRLNRALGEHPGPADVAEPVQTAQIRQYPSAQTVGACVTTAGHCARPSAGSGEPGYAYSIPGPIAELSSRTAETSSRLL